MKTCFKQRKTLRRTISSMTNGKVIDSAANRYNLLLTCCTIIGIAAGACLLLPLSDIDGITSECAGTSDFEDFTTHQHQHSAVILSNNIIADVAENELPTVVNITIAAAIGGLFAGGMSLGSGSGFIISKDGFIATNAHVVGDSIGQSVLVTMWNGKQRNGIVHSIDAISDIALVKIETNGDDLPTVKIGSSSAIRVGEFVIALGSPLFLRNSVTFGIVSSTVRYASDLGISKSRSEYIQTDASVNPGNSGGPLLNIYGEVIGINVAKLANAEGISFAIPIDLAVQVIKQLRQHGKVVRPYLGMKMIARASKGENNEADPSSTFRSKNNFKGARGILKSSDSEVLIVGVTKGSPAHKCGLDSGDVILEIDDKKVKGLNDVFDAIGIEAGKSHRFRVRRQNGVEETVSLRSEAERARGTR